MLAKYLTSILICFSCCQYVTNQLIDPLKLLCNISIPSSVNINNDTWTGKGNPLEDDLDKYVLKKTGCEYEGVKHARGFYPREMTYDGLFAWSGAVRSREYALIQVSWLPVNKSSVTYNFFIGKEGNNITDMYEYDTPNDWEKHTPGILDLNSYVPFYLKIQDEILIFGKICDSEPMFTHNISQSIARGDRPVIFCHSWSYVGAKFLYNCPALVEVNSGGSHLPEAAPLLLLALLSSMVRNH